MSLQFTEDGLQIQTYQEIFDELVAEYQGIYGSDINVDPDSPDGQRIGIEAKARADMQEFMLSLYNQFDPDFAIGEVLNKIIKLSGITRQPASRSQADVTITTDRNLTLPVGYTVEDDLGQSWVTASEASLTTGANTVTLFAETFGDVQADPNTITEPDTIVLGVVSVTNSSAATPGRDEETDAELRVRRNLSLESPATSTVGGLYAALADLSGVTDLIIYENDTDSTDATLSLAAHSLWVVVEGGDVADIVETVAKNKTGGTGLKGSVSGNYIEEVIRPDGSSFYITHEMSFDRPTETPLYITLTVEGIDGATVDADSIKDALAAIDFNIAQDAIASNLYATVYSVADNFIATLLEISDDNVTYTDGSLEPDPDAVFTIDTVDITITDIT